MNEVYCLISKDVQKIEINQYLGYAWNKNTIFNTINIQINHRIQRPFFFSIMLKIDINICTMSIQKDINSQIGYTPSNLVNALLSVRARIAKILSVGVHITESHKVRKIQNMISEFASDKNIISDRIFLFSDLFILEKNIDIHIRQAISNQTK